jgi:hypothetical protein
MSIIALTAIIRSLFIVVPLPFAKRMMAFKFSSLALLRDAPEHIHSFERIG